MNLVRLFASVATLACGAAAAMAQVPEGRLALGGNVNEHFVWATVPVLDQTHSHWVRGFFPASEFMSGSRSYETDPGLVALRTAADSGRKTVLSFKWDSTQSGKFGRIPKPESKEEVAAFGFADKMLEATRGKVGVLCLLNELTIDTMPEDLEPDSAGSIPYIRFLQRLAAHITEGKWKASDGSPLPLLAGGMTRLDQPAMQGRPVVKAMIAWANKDPKIAGLDYHLHQPNLETTKTAAEFMHRAVPSKPLIVTEFSLVWKWKAHLADKIGSSQAGSAFIKKYNLPPGMTVAEYSTAAYAHPVPEAQWRAFLASQEWFEGSYLDKVVPIMHANGVHLATYALTLDPSSRPGRPRRISNDTPPWFLNDVLLPKVVESPDPKRLPQNADFFDSYVKYQR